MKTMNPVFFSVALCPALILVGCGGGDEAPTFSPATAAGTGGTVVAMGGRAGGGPQPGGGGTASRDPSDATAGATASSGAPASGGAASGGATSGGSGSGGNAGTGGVVPDLTPLNTAKELGRSTLTPTSYSAAGVLKAGEYLYGGAMGGHALTYRGYQYVTYYEGNGKVTVARRDLGRAQAVWEKSTVPGYTVTTDDRHNKMASAVSIADGTLHLAFDHHTSPELHYARTKPGVTDAPQAQPWNDQVFTYQENFNRDEWFSGTFPERTVTYPTFLTVGATVMMYWRSGGTAQGRMNLAQYDTATHEWKSKLTFTSEKGVYREGNWSSDSRGPYHAGFVLDPQGNLHVSWLWREGGCSQPGVHYCNHGLYYAWSPDLGATWRDSKGVKVGGGSTPITVESISPVWELGVQFDVSNTSMQSRWVEETGDYEVYLDHENSEAGSQRGTYRYTRSKTGAWTQTKVDKTPGGLGVTLPAGGPGGVPNQTWDFGRLQTEGIATVVYQDEPTTRGRATPLHVVDYRFAE